MIDARHYCEAATLRDGRAVVVRAVRAGDKAAMLAAFHALDPSTVYSRLFGTHGETTEAELRAWTEVDFVAVIRLLVWLPGAEGERVIGGATCARLTPADPAAGAEIAFTIEEDFHGQGLAGQLLQHLVRIARAAGIPRFVAETLPANRAMLAVFAHSGLPMTSTHGDGVVFVTLAL